MNKENLHFITCDLSKKNNYQKEFNAYERSTLSYILRKPIHKLIKAESQKTDFHSATVQICYLTFHVCFLFTLPVKWAFISQMFSCNFTKQCSRSWWKAVHSRRYKCSSFKYMCNSHNICKRKSKDINRVQAQQKIRMKILNRDG